MAGRRQLEAKQYVNRDLSEWVGGPHPKIRPPIKPEEIKIEPIYLSDLIQKAEKTNNIPALEAAIAKVDKGYAPIDLN